MKRIGILGGGQLARMTLYETRKLGFHFTVLDSDENPPAAACADLTIRGSLYSEQDIRKLVESVDIATYDIEHISTEALEQLESEGHIIEPAPRVLRIIQDKYIQKKTFADAGLPVSRFYVVEKMDEINTEAGLFPFVQKARTGGYDGRGVAVITGPEDMDQLLPCPSIIEEFVEFEKELAVMVARTPAGEIRSFPVVEMTFDSEINMCDTVIAPALIPEETAARAGEIAETAVETLGGTGVFGIELFLTKGGEILVNEAAPRPHNSGHYTMEACAVSQFEQHIRAITGLPLGDPDLHRPAVMVNLLGLGGSSGPVRVEGLNEALAVPGCSVHLYGKAESRPNRKMGHATLVWTGPGDADMEEIIGILTQRAGHVKTLIRISGE